MRPGASNLNNKTDWEKPDMMKKTLVAASVAALAAGVVAMPAAASSELPTQLAGCAAKKKCGACGACKAKCGACAAKKCGACAAKKCGACAAKKCGACKAKCGACKAKTN